MTKPKCQTKLKIQMPECQEYPDNGISNVPMRLPRFPFAMLRASAHRNDSGMEDGRAMTREGTGSI